MTGPLEVALDDWMTTTTADEVAYVRNLYARIPVSDRDKLEAAVLHGIGTTEAA